MNEHIFDIDGIDPVSLFGVQSVLLNKIAGYYPQIKIVARGNTVKAMGSGIELDEFSIKFDQCIAYAQKYHRLTPQALAEIFENQNLSPNPDQDDQVLIYGTHGKVIRARTKNQQELVDAFKNNDLLFATGPAGTGKTYTAIALAVRALKNKEVQKIILTRPAVEAGERLGFLPGDLKEKLDPYLQPLYDALRDMIPGKKLESYFEDGTVEIAPLAYMRGRTLDYAFVILDEAQNASLGQIKMFLTRMGKNAKFIVTGDMTQIDLPRKSDSGLEEVLHKLKNIKGLRSIVFDQSDIVRHPLVKQIVNAFENSPKNTNS